MGGTVTSATAYNRSPEFTDAERLGSLLRRARLALGLSQTEAGRLSGLQQRRVSRIESGGQVALAAVLQHVEALRRAGAPVGVVELTDPAKNQASAGGGVGKRSAERLETGSREALTAYAADTSADIVGVYYLDGFWLVVPASGAGRGALARSLKSGEHDPVFQRLGPAGPEPVVVLQRAYPDLRVHALRHLDLLDAGLFAPELPNSGEQLVWPSTHAEDDVQIF